LRFELERKADLDFLADIAAEEADAAAHFAANAVVLDKPDAAALKLEHVFYWNAWQALRFDRFIGSMGGEGPIYYRAVSRFVQDHALSAVETSILRRVIHAMDEEYLDCVAEKAREEEARRQRDHDR
jgi:hypothetical protein